MTRIPLYLKTDNELPRFTDSEFYLLARDGLFFCRNHAFFESDVLCSKGPGWLVEHDEQCQLKFPKIKKTMLERIVGFFRESARSMVRNPSFFCAGIERSTNTASWYPIRRRRCGSHAVDTAQSWMCATPFLWSFRRIICWWGTSIATVPGRLTLLLQIEMTSVTEPDSMSWWDESRRSRPGSISSSPWTGSASLYILKIFLKDTGAVAGAYLVSGLKKYMSR